MGRTVAPGWPDLEDSAVDVDAEIGRLYELPPGEFVAARDELGRRLRAQPPDDRAAAERVRGLRRPTVAAWAVNQVARRHAELVAELVESGDRLHQAQRRALSGLRDSGLRAAAAERRERLDRLVAAASRVLVEAGRPPEPHRDAIAATFEAASVDPEAAAAVRRGTLAHELRPRASRRTRPPDARPTGPDGWTRPSGASSRPPGAGRTTCGAGSGSWTGSPRRRGRSPSRWGRRRRATVRPPSG